MQLPQHCSPWGEIMVGLEPNKVTTDKAWSNQLGRAFPCPSVLIRSLVMKSQLIVSHRKMGGKKERKKNNNCSLCLKMQSSLPDVMSHQERTHYGGHVTLQHVILNVIWTHHLRGDNYCQFVNHHTVTHTQHKFSANFQCPWGSGHPCDYMSEFPTAHPVVALILWVARVTSVIHYTELKKVR